MSVPGMLGPYPIERELGRGGMGVVYLGRDPRLNRPVAIKVIPDALAQNPENLARFEREARLLAAVNHPNIAAVYGVEEAGGHRMLVMEYVAGETLSDRLMNGPLPVSESLDVGRQVAAAIEAAHEGGIVHRDLKPGNVRVTPDGLVKVLDFGLAKGGMTANAELAQSPTLTYSPTAIGVILGTAGYMSPEQARGKPVDRRADVWAFGCVLFECLTARKTFEGDTVSDTIARILEREPAWDALPASLPPRVRELLHRCLEKDLKRRQRDMGDVRIELERAIAERSSASHATPSTGSTLAPRRIWKSIAIGAGLLATGAVLGVGVSTLTTPDPPRPDPVRVSVSVAPHVRAFSANFTRWGRDLLIRGRLMRPDGTEDPKAQVFLRSLDDYTLKPIPGTEDVRMHSRSPDGAWLAVVRPVSDQSSDLQLWRVSIDGSSPALLVTDWDRSWGDLFWMESGHALTLTAAGTKFVRIPMNGGSPSQPETITYEKGGGYPILWSELPGGRGVLMIVESWGPRGYQQDVWRLDAVTGRATKWIENASAPRFVQTSSQDGHVFFSRRGAVMAIPLDMTTMKLGAEAVAVFDGLRNSWENGFFTISQHGDLLFEPGGRLGLDRKLVTVSLTREVTPFVPDARQYESSLTASPDGRHAAVVVANTRGTYEVWLGSVDRSGLRKILSFPNADACCVEWSSDGKSLAFERNGRDALDGIYVQSMDSTAEPTLVYKPASLEEGVEVYAWLKDGAGLLVGRLRDQRHEMFVLPLSANGQPGPPVAVPITRGFTGEARLSPDGKLLAFIADDSGSEQIYVVAMQGSRPVGTPVMVTTDSGTDPRWSGRERRLFYRKAPARLMSVLLDPVSLRPSTPELHHEDLNAFRIHERVWDILPDGRLLGIQRGIGENDLAAYNIVLNWLDSVRSKLR